MDDSRNGGIVIISINIYLSFVTVGTGPTILPPWHSLAIRSVNE